MTFFQKLVKFCTNKVFRFNILASRGFLNHWSDEKFIKRKFKLAFGYELNLDDPQTFNEKLNWLKLHDRKPLYTQLADKYTAKAYVGAKIGPKYVVPMYGTWNFFEEIDFDQLPNQFVLKTTHDSSGVTVCRDKQTFNKAAARAKIKRSLKRKFYYMAREWPYKNIQPRVIAEQFLDDHSGHELTDYKFWCFNGIPKVVYCTNKAANIYENFYDMDFNPLPINHGFSRHIPEFTKPKQFELMKELAAQLSKGIPFVRIDFFNVQDHVYFGEFTFYDWGGMRPFTPSHWDKEIGTWLTLPQINPK